MDIKTAFLNGELEEEIYMNQPPGFIEEGKEHLVCRLSKSIYGLKQASSNDLNLLLETKLLLSNTFDMKDLGEASFVFGIEIKRDGSRNSLGISQRSYIEKILKRFNMEGCSGGEVPVSKGDKLNKEQCPKNDLERKTMLNKPYASLVGSLMDAQAAQMIEGPQMVICSSWLDEQSRGEVQNRRHLQHRPCKLNIVDIISRPIVIHCDNKATVFISKNNKQSSVNRLMDIKYRSVSEDVKSGLLNNKQSSVNRLMDIKYRSVSEDVKSGLLVIKHINTGSMITDPLTKPLPVAVFKQHVAKMGVLESFDSVTVGVKLSLVLFAW
nr:uncharacterized protein LOC114822309 [Malus domestica]